AMRFIATTETIDLVKRTISVEHLHGIGGVFCGILCAHHSMLAMSFWSISATYATSAAANLHDAPDRITGKRIRTARRSGDAWRRSRAADRHARGVSFPRRRPRLQGQTRGAVSVS